jgi:molybdate transport system permease protein
MASSRPLTDTYGLPIGRRAPAKRSGDAPASPRLPWQLELIGLPLVLLLLIPLVALLIRTPLSMLSDYVGDTRTLSAIRLSLLTSAACTLIVVVLGTPLAYGLARRRTRLNRALEVMLDLPIVLPPAVAGLALLMAFGRRGLLGASLAAVGVQIPFTPAAVVLAQIFVGAPYFIKTASVALSAVIVDLEQAASLDGASTYNILRHITLPLAGRGLLGGAALCWARALGEFGATILFAGNLPGRTQTMPLAVYLGLQSDLALAQTLSIILLALSIFILVLVRVIAGTQNGSE